MGFCTDFHGLFNGDFCTCMVMVCVVIVNQGLYSNYLWQKLKGCSVSVGTVSFHFWGEASAPGPRLKVLFCILRAAQQMLCPLAPVFEVLEKV